MKSISEKKVFTFFVFLQLIPFFFFAFMPSMDGPPHLHNTQVLIELLRGNSVMQNFYTFNPVLVGYWTQPVLMSLFNLLFSAQIAEKLLISVYLTGLAFSFRYFVKSLNPDPGYLTILIIPFSYTFFFFLGYYNFSLAFIFVFLALGYYIRNRWSFTWKTFLILFVLISMVFLTHSFVFAWFCIGLFIFVTLRFLGALIKGASIQLSIKSFIKNGIFLFLAALPALIFFVFHFLHVRQVDSTVFTDTRSFSQLIDFLIRIRLIIGYHISKESTPNFVYQLVFLTVLIVSFISFFRNTSILSLTIGELIKRLTNPKNAIFLVSLFFLLVYFIIPETVAAGDLDIRVSVFFFYFFIARIAAIRLSKKISFILAMIVILAFIQQSMLRYRMVRDLIANSKDVYSLQEFAEPNAVIFPYRVSSHWLDLHYPMYVGVDKPVIHLGNPQVYGAAHLIWNNPQLPVLKVGNLDVSNHHGRIVENDGSRDEYIVDYVIVYRYNEFRESEDHNEFKEVLEHYYELLKISPLGTAALYNLREKIPEH